MRTRFRYQRTLPADIFRPAAPPAGRRHPTPADHAALAQLMLDAYRGTPDDDGETLADAEHAITHYWDELNPLLDCSWVIPGPGGRLQAACLIGWYPPWRAPIIAYIMTHPDAKRQGLAANLVRASLVALADRDYSQVYAVITAGNTPSEQLFHQLGFTLAP